MQSHYHHRRLSSRRAARGASVAMACLALAVILAPRDAPAQVGPQGAAASAAAASADAAAYWTPERMRNAIPMELLAVPPAGAAVSASAERQLPPDARPGYSPGFPPGPGPKPDPTVRYELTEEQARALAAQPQTSPPFSPPALPTDFSDYAPFQRWTWFGNYFTYPISTIGKLFFVQNGTSFVCSASVIANNTIATAGHCVHDGSGSASGWSSSFLFCPSFTPSGCIRGSWGFTFEAVSGNWFASGATDRDYGCVVTAMTGTIFASPVGSITGATGRAWNFPSRQATFAYGYPQAAPFLGNRIMATASTEWYEVNMTISDGLVSKYIGSDQTGGSSGGPWWLSLRHPDGSFERPDTDGSLDTDPFQAAAFPGPYINGVNSHKRCNAGGCPAGSIFTQEMGSPQFRNTAPDGDESEDLHQFCFSNGGT